MWGTVRIRYVFLRNTATSQASNSRRAQVYVVLWWLRVCISNSSWRMEIKAWLGRSQHNQGFLGSSVCTMWRMCCSIIEDEMIFRARPIWRKAARSSQLWGTGSH